MAAVRMHIDTVPPKGDAYISPSILKRLMWQVPAACISTAFHQFGMRIRTHGGSNQPTQPVHKPTAAVAFLQLQGRCNLHDSYYLAWSSFYPAAEERGICTMITVQHIKTAYFHPRLAAECRSRLVFNM